MVRVTCVFGNVGVDLCAIKVVVSKVQVWVGGCVFEYVCVCPCVYG